MDPASADSVAKDFPKGQLIYHSLQRKSTNPLSTAEITDLLAEAPSETQVHKTLSVLAARLDTRRSYCDPTSAQQICTWTLNNVFGPSSLSNDYLSNRNRLESCNIALVMFLDFASHFPDLIKEITLPQVCSFIVCSALPQTDTIHRTDITAVVISTAQMLLGILLDERTTPPAGNSQNLTTNLLEQIVRPSFAKSRPRNITTAGRKTINPLPQALTASEDEKLLKPWKFTEKYVVSVLQWILKDGYNTEVEANWHLITPPVLTLIDDEAIASKIHGCNALRFLLRDVPATMWTRTGLGKVFEAALTPALAYLPPLTDPDEAEQLIQILYPTLISLCNCQFSSPDEHAKRLAMLDNLMRAGVLSGLAHSGDNVRISTLLLDQLCLVLKEMGIHCVKHLKPIIAVLVGYLTDPFAFASTTLLKSAIRALEQVIVNAWPRISRYSGEIFKGIAVCWQRLSEEPISEEISNIQTGLKVTLKLLLKTLDGNDSGQEILRIIQKDQILLKLLP